MGNISHARAIVIGASLGGLLAARALSETYSTVTVIDHDSLPDGPATRRGTPQSRHVHILLARGREALDELFPGFTAEMMAAGCPAGDCQSELGFYNDGHRLARATSGLIALGASRPLIEHTTRTRVAALPGVEIRTATHVETLATDPTRTRVTGVRVRADGGSGPETVLDADLVVDASGRGSRSPLWLKELGYRPPKPEQVKVNITYLTRHYRREPHHLGGDLGVGNGAYPGQLRGGYALAQEGGQFALTLVGMLGTEAPPTDEGMAAYADTLTSNGVAEIIRTARPLDSPVKMRYPASTRLRYEKLSRFPEGYLVVADALCSFNPVYGQGMTVAALEALLLRDVLAAGTNDVARRFFRGAAAVIDIPWAIATGADLRFPGTEGKRTLMVRVLNAYLARFHVAAEADPVLGTAFLRVANLIDSPGRLLSPGIMRRVFWAKFRRPSSWAGASGVTRTVDERRSTR